MSFDYAMAVFVLTLIAGIGVFVLLWGFLEIRDQLKRIAKALEAPDEH